MRAVVFDRTLRFESHYPDPVVGEGECLVRIHVAGICATDLHLIRGYLNFTGVLGHEMVGSVVDGPPQWKNKRVVCEINCVCQHCDLCQSGLSSHCRKRMVLGIDGRDGVFADFVSVPQRNLHAVPDVVSDEEAVFVEPLAAAYQVLAQCRIEKRMNVSVVGPGRLGLLVAQVIKNTGCKLTAIGRNPKKLLLCEKKGVQAVHVDDLVPHADRDVVVECTGAPEGLAIAMQLVRPRGTIILKSTYVAPRRHAGAFDKTETRPSGSGDNDARTTPTRHDSQGAPRLSHRTETRPSGSGTQCKSASSNALDLAPLVINEVTLLGSRCGPFPEALNALARQAVEVRSMISKTFPIEQALEAFDAAQDPENVKILLKINPR